jgi:hypothetical protein
VFSGAASPAGVHDSRVESLSEGALRCFYSQLDRFAAVSREDALAFHHVVNGIFRQAAVISIRFPTLLQGDEELRDFLRKQGTQYSAALVRLRDSIQMELHISATGERAAAPPTSGKAYLEARRSAVQNLAAVAGEAHNRIRNLATEWRVRPGSSPNRLRCYVLLPRVAEQDFRRQIESLPAPQSIKVILSGPWPCSEFME